MKKVLFRTPNHHEPSKGAGRYHARPAFFMTDEQECLKMLADLESLIVSDYATVANALHDAEDEAKKQLPAPKAGVCQKGGVKRFPEIKLPIRVQLMTDPVRVRTDAWLIRFAHNGSIYEILISHESYLSSNICRLHMNDWLEITE